jgi:ketosteroid isomerase-like protein
VSANIALARSIYDAWERGDFSSADWADPEMEWTAIGGPEPSSGKGLTAVGAAWRDFLAAWGDYRAAADDFRELDAERVLVLVTTHARGRASGLETEGGTKGAHVLSIREGKVATLVLYWDRERGLADLGLEA